MTANQIVLRVIEALDQCSIPYMLVGSYSSNTFGQARSTQDADFVIELGNQSITPLFEALSTVLTFDPQMRLESVTGTLRYIGKHKDSGFKVEIFLTSNDPHDRERFRRRLKRPFLTAEAWLPTAEDVVIQKLRWFHLSRRAKDRDDVANVLANQTGKLDMAYIRRWCDQQGSRELLEQLLEEIENIQKDPP